MYWVRLFSSMNVSGQTVSISSRFSRTCPLCRTSASRMSNAFGGKARGVPCRSNKRSAASIRKLVEFVEIIDRPIHKRLQNLHGYSSELLKDLRLALAL